MWYESSIPASQVRVKVLHGQVEPCDLQPEGWPSLNMGEGGLLSLVLVPAVDEAQPCPRLRLLDCLGLVGCLTAAGLQV